ncbi:hypothetical protein [Hymenobacter lucidus]|uniref:Uncharacterized protein n=1 Tax=Hymenobacter lucidus TaxID=2880930 RepID=A0ABS8AYZ0_9BACT|nr:hypothetical protein [Hymenobacter lucidus]MCB2411021.1 hypothetical protein [Hymenobacter lucidus]
MDKNLDFELWLDELQLDDYHDIYALHEAVDNGVSANGFTCYPVKESEGEFVVHKIQSDESDRKLSIVSEDAKSTFLRVLRKKYMSGLDADLWFDLQRDKQKGA